MENCRSTVSLQIVGQLFYCTKSRKLHIYSHFSIIADIKRESAPQTIVVNLFLKLQMK